MPLRMSIPLPGPFTYSARIGGGRRGSAGKFWYWLLIGWWAVPLWLLLKWTSLAVWWTGVGMWKLGVLLVALVAGDRRPTA